MLYARIFSERCCSCSFYCYASALHCNNHCLVGSHEDGSRGNLSGSSMWKPVSFLTRVDIRMQMEHTHYISAYLNAVD